MNGPWLTGLGVDVVVTNESVSSVTLPWGATTNVGTAAGLTDGPMCDEWGCGLNGPNLTGFVRGVDETPPGGGHGCPKWGCNENGPQRTGLRAELVITDHQIVSLTLPSGAATNDGAASGPTGKPQCDEWGCGMNGPSPTGFVQGLDETPPGGPTGCPTWGCNQNGPQRSGLRAELKITDHQIVSLTLLSGTSMLPSSGARTVRPGELRDLDQGVDETPPGGGPTGCPKWGCNENGPHRSGLRAEVKVTEHEIVSLTLPSGRTSVLR